MSVGTATETVDAVTAGRTTESDDMTVEGTAEAVGTVIETGATDGADEEEAAADRERLLLVVVVVWPLTDRARGDEEEEGEDEKVVADVRKLDELAVEAEP